MLLTSWLTSVLLVSISGAICGQASAQVQVGSAINLFSRFGYLGLSMRVVPRNETDRSWIFREPTVNVFNISDRDSAKRSIGKGPTFQGDFHMEFCDNIVQLLQAYFRDFSVERLEKPWKAFTASWTRNVISRNFGIASNLVNTLSEERYVLVRVARHREAASIPEMSNANGIDDGVQNQIDDIKLGDVAAVAEFIRSYGSHYITSFVTGNSLYQVFVYDSDTYREIKEKLRVKGIANIPHAELMQYFSPFFAKHVGKILSASGNETVENWANTKLLFSVYGVPFPSLLKLHSNARLLYELEGLLGNEALLKLDLKTLAPAFKDVNKKEWFHHVLDNLLKLWEVNM